MLLVGFRLRAVRGQLAHAMFRFESLFNTPLFVGFPGFVSKLWVAHDSNDIYRGAYEWDGATLAEDYVRTLWRVLALVCVPGSIHYEIVPGLTRGELLRDPATLDTRALAPDARGAAAHGRRAASGVAGKRYNGCGRQRSNCVGWSLDLGRGPSPLVLRFGMRDGRR